MFANFVYMIALRYFRSRKQEKFISVISTISLIGITIGVAALIVVMSVMNGFHIELIKNINGLNGDINITPMGSVIKHHEDVVSKIKQLEFVEHVTEVVQGQGLALGQRNNSGVLIKGLNLADLKQKKQILEGLMSGDFADYEDDNAVALGAELAQNLGVEVGQTLKIISPNTLSTAFGSMPRAKDFKIIALFQSGLYDYDAATVLMKRGLAQRFLSIGDGINLIEVSTTAPDQASFYARKIQPLLGFSARAVSWEQKHKTFLDALAVEQVAMFTILSLIIIVAAFNIISSLFMLVKDKTLDIAILKTIGASTKQIMLIFMLSGMIVGVLGTILGVVIGLTIASNLEGIRVFLEKAIGIKLFDPIIYFLYTLPSVVRMQDVVTISLIALLLCFLATLYPSYKAAKLNPVEAMRYE